MLALTLPGHAGGPPLEGPVSHDALVEPVERAMDEAGFETAHIAGNSLGGFLALQLAARGRARSVVALCPAGGWDEDDDTVQETFDRQAGMVAATKAAAPHVDAIVASPEGRRRATAYLTENFEHIPPELIAHLTLGFVRCEPALALIDRARHERWTLDAGRIPCPVRVVWGTEDKLLPWPRTAARFRRDWLPNADWVELDGVGHCPQLDVPAVAADLILGFTGR